MADKATSPTFDAAARARACTMNPHYKQTVPWTSRMPWWGQNPATEEAAWIIFRFQVANGLVADGIAGPVTCRAYVSVSLALVTDFIIVRGKKVNIEAPVVCYTEVNGLSFYAFQKTSGKRVLGAAGINRAIQSIAMHHDACSSARQCFQVLCTKGISSAACIDNDGVIYQFCDFAELVWATGSYNDFCTAFDISNLASAQYFDYYAKLGPAQARPLVKRTIYSQVGPDKWSPWTFDSLGFTSAQVKSTTALLRALGGSLGIPLQLPPRLAHTPDILCKKNGKYHAEFKGIVGHLHVTPHNEYEVKQSGFGKNKAGKIVSKWDPAGLDFDLLRVSLA